MAEVIGFLRNSATFGEKKVLQLLSDNLPKEFIVYVETPLYKERDIRYPDFVVLTNYGVLVLEVKDWVVLEGRATPHGVTVRNRDGTTRHEPNPVNQARNSAIVLSQKLNEKRKTDQAVEAIPWSYAVVLFNLPTPVITQLRTPWGEEFVLGKADLENRDLLLNRIKRTFPTTRLRPLTKKELDLVRATIYPVVEIEMPDREAFVLDQQQEKIVAEPVRQVEEQPIKQKQGEQQDRLFSSNAEDEDEKPQPLLGEKISRDVSIRLVRGFSGSGKTLVLIQRARFLAAQYPEWRIVVLTYNKPLQTHLEKSLLGTGIQAKTFHGLCKQLTKIYNDNPAKLEDWLAENQKDFPIIAELGKDFAEREIDYLRDLGVPAKEKYLKMERKGMGRGQRIPTEQRAKIYELLTSYRQYLQDNDLWDFSELPLILQEQMDKSADSPELFDAILVDEAQDWAPIWFKVINRLLNAKNGLLFLADDPSQSIYRNFSWREKSVEVVGRTRWLKVPYRNTYEIYQAAYEMISDNDEIQNSLKEEGEWIRPEVNPVEMRHGKRPLVQRLANIREEIYRVKNIIDSLKTDGIREDQIAVLTRYRREAKDLERFLQDTSVVINPIHGFKGLEMEAVILPHINLMFQDAEEETSERRLIYMAMSRAREQLYLTYSGRLPTPFNTLRTKNLVDFLG
ncbi:MAG: UvrD-helicase domain-containing protein [Chloroflexi bacterium]|nr:UvrD-helicase domain-containing protein [Chloroflexota bacterium]